MCRSHQVCTYSAAHGVCTYKSATPSLGGFMLFAIVVIVIATVFFRRRQREREQHLRRGDWDVGTRETHSGGSGVDGREGARGGTRGQAGMTAAERSDSTPQTAVPLQASAVLPAGMLTAVALPVVPQQVQVPVLQGEARQIRSNEACATALALTLQQQQQQQQQQRQCFARQSVAVAQVLVQPVAAAGTPIAQVSVQQEAQHSGRQQRGLVTAQRADAEV